MRVDLVDRRVHHLRNAAEGIEGVALALAGRDGIDSIRIKWLTIDENTHDALTLRGESAKAHLDPGEARHPAAEASLGIGREDILKLLLKEGAEASPLNLTRLHRHRDGVEIIEIGLGKRAGEEGRAKAKSV